LPSFDIDFALLLPEFLLAGLGFLVVGVELFLPDERKNRVSAAIAAVGLVGIMAFSLVFLWGEEDSLYDGLYRIDKYALLFKALFMGIGIAVVLMSVEYVGRKMRHAGEYYGLLIFSILGAVMMAASGELLTAYISLELLSFSLYALVSLTRGDRRSAEAGVKYILLGALSSAVMLYGISLLYGTLETTYFQAMAVPLLLDFAAPTVVIGLSMVVAGLGFKVAMVPFHMWAPDVYEGAPTPITAYLAVLSKAAAFALVLRFFAESLFLSLDEWQFTLAVFAAATMTVGNLVALAQHNIKRLLAYSSIAQVGYLLMGVVALTPDSSSALILHLVGYAFTTLAAFTVVIIVETHTGKEEVKDFAGLGDRAPFSALVMTAALLSLAGLPFFAGFVTKFYLFTSTADAGLLWLVGLAIANSLISLYYYLNVMRQMYIEEPEDRSPLSVAPLTTGVLALMLAGMLFVGVYPGPLLDLVDAARDVLPPFLPIR
jgi:NADH-quinone oxidoreductase subunit N